MLFNSPLYIFVFLPFSFIIYFLFNKKNWITIGRCWLVFVSLAFYGYANPKYVLLLSASIAVNFGLGKAIQQRSEKKGLGNHLKTRRKVILFSGVLWNLGLLAYFKYTDFLIKNINFAMGTKIPILEMALPLAISFFSFQQITYLVDTYKSKIHEFNFLDYCLYVSFFPQLIAGPIVRYHEMIPQFRKNENSSLNWQNVATGIFVFSLGLFKKVIIADAFAVWANAGFDTTKILTLFEAWGTSLSYTFQIYYDFSGYTDMAIGAALLFNIHIPINFNSPYKAVNIQDFWRRWHITLSNWLKNYLYFPLGGNRKGQLRTYLNLFITFLLGGLWHGAGWTFIIWGAMHGGALVIHRLWQRLRLTMPIWGGWLLTFIFVNTSWVFLELLVVMMQLRY